MQIFRAINFSPSSGQLVLAAALVLTLVFNYPFLAAVYDASMPNSWPEYLFYLSVPLVLTCLNVIFISVFGALLFPRIKVALTFLTSGLLFYAAVSYGVVFDQSMIQNVIETNPGEAISYFNLSFLLFFVVLALAPFVFVFSQTLRCSVKQRLKQLAVLNVTAVVVIVLVAAFLYKDYASVGRNNKNLTHELIPYAFYVSGYKYLRDTYFYPPLPYRVLDKHPVVKADMGNVPKTLVVVVGETARAENFGSNGYRRQTTPNIESRGAVSFENVTSCGTATAVSVPCMFSRLGRSEYDARIAGSQDNVLDIIKRAGESVLWIDNNSSCKGACARIDTIEFDPARDPQLCDGDFCLDQILVSQLADELTHKQEKSRVIVLHMIGSHGPTYYRRYPSSFSRFLPDCPRSDIQNCDAESLVNTYDNTIAYTDYIIGEVISLIENQPNTAMLYISDHGESLGEKGLYLHGFPYKLAPEEQTHVPMVYWDSKFSDENYRSCVNLQKSVTFSQDNLYDTLLGLANVSSSTYNPNMDIFNQCQV